VPDVIPSALRLLLGRRTPITDGLVYLEGLRRPLTIHRDRFGIAYIDAETDEDAWFGLGFCQAQDRAFQLELRLRTVRGSLSQLFGAETVNIDRLARRIGFVESGQRQLDVLEPDVRAQIEAFVAGINAGQTAGLPRSTPEFGLLRAQPTPWTPADVLGVGKLMSFLLIGNWDVELARLRILQSDGPEALQALDPANQADLSPVRPEPLSPSARPEALEGRAAASARTSAAERLAEDLQRFLEFAGAGGGSNAWAVAGERTGSGRPILANDPHLDSSMPPHWYLASLRTPGWSVAGAALIGAPGFASAHNGFCAWGVTAALTDTTDLFIEDVAPDGRSVRHGDAFEPCELRRELIEVKDEASVVEDVLVTPRGPIVGPALNGEDLGAISMRAVWLDARPARGFLEVHKARSFEQFRAAFAEWPMLPQNVVYADTTGRIAWQLVGEAPRRRAGWGTLPASGADPNAGWLDEGVPFDQMPFVVDPPSGFVASANNAPWVTAQEPSPFGRGQGEGGAAPYLGDDFLDSYRYDRIAEALTGADAWDVADTQRLQLDQTSLLWRELRDAVLAAPASTPDAQRALDLLRDWDGIVSAGSTAATVFELFFAEIWRRIAKLRAPNAWRTALGEGFGELMPATTFAGGRPSRIARYLTQQPPGWFEDGWPAEIAHALAAAIHDITSGFGDDESKWGWGSARPLLLQHPLGRIKQLASLFNRGPFAWGGDGTTVAQAGQIPLRPLSNPSPIASLRVVIDVGDWEASRFVLPGGQSGDPFSPHYDDMLPLWLRGEGVPIAWSDQAVARATLHTLRLEPRAPQTT
jgi:penicillin amidase